MYITGLLLRVHILLTWRGGEHSPPEKVEPALRLAGGGGGLPSHVK